MLYQVIWSISGCYPDLVQQKIKCLQNFEPRFEPNRKNLSNSDRFFIIHGRSSDT
jgi:hypothetical protein